MIKIRKSSLIFASLTALTAIAFVFIIPRLNQPVPQTHSYLISAGGVSRAIIQQEYAHSPTGKYSPPRLPHHLDFKAGRGTVDVYVVRFPSGGAVQQVNAMLNLTEELKAGRPPKEFVARGSGESGRIDLNWWPYGTTKYLVMIHAERESEVTLVVHYGP
ncbi:MAG: hypothetical protein V2A74_01520 [bacterium]